MDKKDNTEKETKRKIKKIYNDKNNKNKIKTKRNTH